MEALGQQGFQDPLSATAAASTETQRTSALSVDESASLKASGAVESPTPGSNQEAPDGNEGTEAVDLNKNDATDSSSTWSPEVMQPDI